MTQRKISVLRIATAVLLVLLLASGLALANGKAKVGAKAEAAVGSSSTYLVATGAYRGGPPRSSARFTLEFVDADLIDVFQALATQSGVNIAVSGSVKGKTTLRLRKVTLEQALTIVTKLNGLDYAWVEAAYVVGTPEEVRAMRVSELRSSVVVLQHIQPEYAQEVLSKLTPEVTVSTQKGVRSVLLLAPEASLAKAERTLAEIDVEPMPTPPTTEVVPVRYLKADQMAEIISMAVPDVVVQPGPQPNSLLITADSRQWESVRSAMAASDVAPSPSQATQKIYTVKYMSPTELKDALATLAPDLVVTLAPRSFTPVVQQATGGAGQTAQLLAAPQYAAGGATGAGGAGGAAGVTIEAAPITALILSGAPWVVERGMEILETLDKAPRQVKIAAMVTEVNRDDVTRLGIDWGPSGAIPTLGATGVPFVIGEAIPADAEITDNTIPARELQVGKIQRSFLQWNAAIRALEIKHRARVLSNPSVTTLDGRQTALHTGDSIYYEVIVAQGTVGGAIRDTRTVNVGVMLVVNPRVNDKDEVTLTISPTVSTAILGPTGLPIVSEKSMVTTVRVKSGETVVLAGLIKDQEDVITKKVPFLGDIPLVGELFKHREKNPVHQEVLIFVTPTILAS